MAPVVLLVNHREPNCGVYQFFTRISNAVLKSTKYKIFYIDIENEQEFDHWSQELNPSIVVYNYYSVATMPWLTATKINSQRNKFKQLSIFHELDIFHMGFDYLLHQDPTNTDTRYFTFSRPIPEYKPIKWECEVPVIGSFGFGLGGKGFTRIIEYVQRDFDRAIIRLNIPFAAFGDKNGDGARNWSTSCQSIISKPEIQLKITHDMLPENELLDWLAMNSLNCFLYDANIGRGISGTLDYALAAGKPIAITRSDQFRHFWTISEECLVDNSNLCAIMQKGIDHLQIYHQKWGSIALLADFEAVFDKILA